jgi:aryl-alcohol dehydrogenase-like predicted oxidoreductase
MNSAKNTSSKFALGTVQFGLDYGVANRQGRIGVDEGRKILDEARNAGVDTIDTAIAYGISEATLGKIGVRSWRIVSKLPEIPEGVDDVESWVESQIEGSLHRLNVARLDALLLHRPSDIFSAKGKVLPKALQKCQTQGLIGKVGVSIYAPAELPAVLDALAVDLVQAPLNIFDRRMTESGWMERLSAKGIEVHVRSVFLQGLLLLSATQRPAKFAPWQPLWEAWEAWLSQNRLSALETAIRFVWNVAGVGKLVVGVDSAEHMRQILAIAPRPLADAPDFSALVDERLINPSVWGRL